MDASCLDRALDLDLALRQHARVAGGAAKLELGKEDQVQGKHAVFLGLKVHSRCSWLRSSAYTSFMGEIDSSHLRCYIKGYIKGKYLSIFCTCLLLLIYFQFMCFFVTFFLSIELRKDSFLRAILAEKDCGSEATLRAELTW